MPRRPSQIALFALLVVGCGGIVSPSPAAHELTVGSVSLPPGTYARSGFEPSITLEVGEGWFAGSVVDGFFDVQQGPGTPSVVAVQFAVVDGIVGAEGSVVPATTAEAAARTVHDNPDIAVIEESESLMSGLTGSNIVVENQGDAHASVLMAPPGLLGIDTGRRLWISFFDTPSGLLAVMVGGLATDWDNALLVAEPVLESVKTGR